MDLAHDGFADRYPEKRSPVLILGIPTDSKAIDAFWVVFLICITRITLMPDINALAWLLADGLAFLAILADSRTFLATMNRNKLLLAVPVMAILSGLWSLTPTASSYHGVQFLLSFLVAFVFFPKFTPRRLLVIIFVYGVFLQLCSIYVYVKGGYWHDGFPGVFQHKNLMGMFSTLQIFTALTLFLAGWRRKLCFLSLALAFFFLAKSTSGTSIVLTVVVLAMFPAIRVVQKGMAPTFVMMGLGAVAFSIVALLALLYVNVDPTETVLRLLGKDSTLTGRSTLWDFGMQSIDDNPWLGVGFLAYWNSSESSVAYLNFVIEQVLGMFHNVYVEVAVALGFTGLAVFVTGMAQNIVRALIYLTQVRSPEGSWPFIFLVWVSMLSTAENPIFGNTHLQFILAATAAATYGSGLRGARGG